MLSTGLSPCLGPEPIEPILKLTQHEANIIEDVLQGIRVVR